MNYDATQAYLFFVDTTPLILFWCLLYVSITTTQNDTV